MSRPDDETPSPPPPQPSEAAQREARLAQALRANLRRRKAAARPDEAPRSKG